MMLETSAPSGDTVVAYDRRNLLIYAELLDSADTGVDWRAGALDILGIDPAIDGDRARACWESHLARARWIVGDGLASALIVFGERAQPNRPAAGD